MIKKSCVAGAFVRRDTLDSDTDTRIEVAPHAFDHYLS